MLAKIHRLRLKRDFEQVFEKGRTAQGTGLAVKIIPNQSRDTRCGIIVGKKVFAKAVQRNKVKRRMREAFRKILPLLLEGYDIVLMAQKEAQGKTTQELQEAISQLLKRFGILIKP